MSKEILPKIDESYLSELGYKLVETGIYCSYYAFRSGKGIRVKIKFYNASGKSDEYAESICSVWANKNILLGYLSSTLV